MSSWLPVHYKEHYSRSLRHRLVKVNRKALWLCVAISVITLLHSVLRYTRPEYAHLTSVANITAHFQWTADAMHNASTNIASEYELGSNGTRRANAVLLMLARNSELNDAITSVKELEQRFNRRFNYPWVFLNEVPFTDEFKESMSSIVSGPVSFGLIPPDNWYQPDWIDEEKAADSRAQMVAENVVYGGSVSYRNMCRFNSGFFYRHPLVQRYKWYWRVEPNVHFHCDTDYDPFLFMEENDKLYGFTITLYEWPKTVATLWDAVKEFIDANPQYLPANNSMKYLSNDGGASYNMCHFWSNFEIASMDLWRGEAYSKFFEHLESKGGFYYERWGDAPVHSIGAGLFARKDQIHFFDDIGYQHDPFQHCPRNAEVRRARNCTCNPFSSFDYWPSSCLSKWEQVLRS
ncbi:glycosyltransferase family 15 protein [Trametes coccinea BRFM310]|uniref:Glycosyltransferase family 15 protein n=1 Tax=Trametes coccinea (strain BRFM310) TaxID=1353009 RepID=A0A1Y2IEV0_TRAC3|nr:glycosyltransferase family 15 protein [Trametes coccinea BRFM310]